MTERLVELYMYHAWGGEDKPKQLAQAATCLFQYLLEAGISEQECADLAVCLPRAVVPEPSLLPDSLWENSLLARNKFYWHKALRLRPGAAMKTMQGSWILLPDYLEMKIRFSLEDLLGYARQRIVVPKPLQDAAKDKGGLTYLLAKSRWEFCEPIDAVLKMIDLSEGESLVNLLDIQQSQLRAYQELNEMIAAAKLEGCDKIKWRTR